MQEIGKTVKTSSKRMLAACCNVLQLVCVKAVRGPVTSYKYGTGSDQSQFSYLCSLHRHLMILKTKLRNDFEFEIFHGQQYSNNKSLTFGLAYNCSVDSFTSGTVES